MQYEKRPLFYSAGVETIPADESDDTQRAQEVRFEFQVQLPTSEQTMPIEDPTIDLPEDEGMNELSRASCISREVCDRAIAAEAGNSQRVRQP